MIDLYTYTTPNGRKPAIMLEEIGLPHTIHKIDISKGEQHRPDYLVINPNGKIPAMVDRETGIRVFESGAILMYLAEKSGQLMPKDLAGRYEVIEWVMFQMSAVGPMLGQLGFFKRSAELVPMAIDRYTREGLRLCQVLDRQLQRREYIAGDYSIADIATYPWIAGGLPMLGTVDFPHLQAWIDRVGERPAVKRGMAVLSS